MNILSFDIGGTKIAYALVNEHGQVMSEVKKIKTPETAERIKEKLQEIIMINTFDGLAFATAGVVYDNKLAKKPFNLPEGYENIDFSSFAKVPVLVENDANAAAWCEYKIGNAKNCEHAIVLALGTGVGCGIICNGKLLKGKGGAAGECSFKISGKDLVVLAKKNNLPPDCFEIFDLVLKKNKKAQMVYNTWKNRLIKALCLLNDLFDTQKIILAGSLAEIVNYENIQKKIDMTSIGESPLIMKSKGHKFPALIGVALLWHKIYKKEK